MREVRSNDQKTPTDYHYAIRFYTVDLMDMPILLVVMTVVGHVTVLFFLCLLLFLFRFRFFSKFSFFEFSVF